MQSCSYRLIRSDNINVLAIFTVMFSFSVFILNFVFSLSTLSTVQYLPLLNLKLIFSMYAKYDLVFILIRIIVKCLLKSKEICSRPSRKFPKFL